MTGDRKMVLIMTGMSLRPRGATEHRIEKRHLIRDGVRIHDL